MVKKGVDDRQTLRIFRPGSLAELIALTSRFPEAQLYAGGTALNRHASGPLFGLSGIVVCLQGVPELLKISRTERYIDIGAGVTIQKVLSIGKNVLPRALAIALRGIGTPGIRNLATIGGNICNRSRRLDAFPVLEALDAHVEIRGHISPRWEPLSRLVDAAGSVTLMPGEIVTRIRIPLEQWQTQVFRKLGTEHLFEQTDLTFCGLAKIRAGILSEVRITIGSIGPQILRLKQAEGELAGTKLPVSDKDLQAYLFSLEVALSQNTPGPSEFQKSRVRAMANWFLQSLQ